MINSASIVKLGNPFAQLPDTIWRNPYDPLADTLGPMGRIAQLVGLICGFRIAMQCQYQLNLMIC